MTKDEFLALGITEDPFDLIGKVINHKILGGPYEILAVYETKDGYRCDFRDYRPLDLSKIKTPSKATFPPLATVYGTVTLQKSSSMGLTEHQFHTTTELLNVPQDLIEAANQFRRLAVQYGYTEATINGVRITDND